MQVDETGRDDQACGVNLHTRTDRLFVQRDYLTVPDTNMAHSVQACSDLSSPRDAAPTARGHLGL